MHCHGQSTTQPTAPEPTAAWVAVVPVKPLPAAKTRLRGAVPEAVHPDLVLAMARDTVAAALACRAVARVVVVCDDPAVCAELTELGASCLPDTPAAGLNAALTYGALAAGQAVDPRGRADAPDPETAGARRGGAEASPGGAGPSGGGVETSRGVGVAVVALTADLPAMRPEDLEAALVAAARAGRRAFVPDLEGTGTVLLAAPAGEALAPQFGPGSAAAHQRSGAVRLDGDWPSLRRDVDTAADLDAAARLGLGAHTGQVLCTVA
ncbi:NTP transferase domain-containing protein [Dactylosporangium vinaceum]|uniref:Phosphoenolpyruvate guanylyltransferase n=1 Tax=Dactylosporangium vinaceum TaxID=53362 RepID=A0ABV5M7W0_9ACTN|nr:NTP transferase domain-containing protein [Dactylosporangium vinaceum]UAB98053.1 NTP transferase domain-containing protein [Dactylosporangium vinaceum]